jgi:tetratricopeptide (TPR) repeat protein
MPNGLAILFIASALCLPSPPVWAKDKNPYKGAKGKPDHTGGSGSGALYTTEKKQPDKPLAHDLRGSVLLAKQDVAGARRSFERALVIDPSYFQAAANLARLDLREKKPEDAIKRFDAILAKDPKNVQALLAVASVVRSQGEELVRVPGPALVNS